MSDPVDGFARGFGDVPLANIEDRPRTAIDTEAETEAETVHPSAARTRTRSQAAALGVATASFTLDSVTREGAAARFERDNMNPRGTEDQSLG